ncbi:MAG: cation-translocating P-type ATPase [Bacillota bacterium]
MPKTFWYGKSAEEIIRILDTDASSGLQAGKVPKLLAEYGTNELAQAPPRRLLEMLLGQLKETLVIILVIAAIVSGLVGEIEDTIVILAIVILNAVLGVYQENRAEQSLRALKGLTKPLAKVIRNRKIMQIPAAQLVPGDLVLLDTGDYIPADGRVIEAVNLQVDEAALTGESLPVEKLVSPIEGEDVPLGDQANMVFMGTIVTGGRGRAIVTSTGMATQIGQIATMLQEAPQEPTPLQKRLGELGKMLGMAALAIVIMVFFTGLWRGEPLVTMFMTSVSLAVAAVPEGLPTVVTIVLALGVQRMSKRNAVIRKLPAVETLGTATVICSDKTGTLTKNEMTVVKAYVGGQTYALSGIGYQPEGVITAAEGTAPIIPKEGSLLSLFFQGGMSANDARLDEIDGNFRIIGDPTEGALLVAAAKAGFHQEELNEDFPRIAEIPFDSARKMMTTFHRWSNGVVSFTKGAPDILLERSSHVQNERGQEPLDEGVRKDLMRVNSTFAAQGMRVLALGCRWWKVLPSDLSSAKCEQELTFLGFFAMLDPARPEAKEAVAISRQAGIRTIMITGDHMETAEAIAKELGIWQEGDQVLSGRDLDRMDQQGLNAAVPSVSVFARVSPEHKMLIINALKHHGHVVAMTGDGVNDAPALKRADIGAAMGITGTEVAKEAADMVLLDDNFATIISAVEEGRTIFANIRKTIQYLLSCNTGEIIAIFTAILLGLGSPLTPIQILWLNLVTDGPPALALGLDKPEKGIMQRPPRKPFESIFSGGLGARILWQGALIGVLAVIAYWWGLSQGRTLAEARTMAFLTMSLSQLVHAFNVRHPRLSLGQIGLFTNRALVYAFLLSISLQVAVVFVPVLRSAFDTVVLVREDWLIVLALGLVPLLIVELEKLIRRRSKPALFPAT